MSGRKQNLSPALTIAGDLRILISQLKRRLREQASGGDFTPSQLAVLHRLERHGPATVTNLAKAEGVRPQSMGATISVLETAGLVSGAPDPTDGRQTVLSITPLFSEKVKEVRSVREDWLCHAIETKLGANEQKELARAIELLKRIVDN